MMDIQYILPPLSLFKTNNSPKMYIAALLVTVVLQSYSLTLSRPLSKASISQQIQKGQVVASMCTTARLISHTVKQFVKTAGKLGTMLM